MDKVFFDNDTFFWLSKNNFLNDRELIKEDAVNFINPFFDSSISDAYPYKQAGEHILDFTGVFNINNKLDEVSQFCINKSKEIWDKEQASLFNKVNLDIWLNVVRSLSPIQTEFKNRNEIKFHTHTEINKEQDVFYPHYTFVYYIQMPNFLEGNDGVLFIKGQNNKIHSYLPQEGDLVILPGSLPHAPNNAPKASTDRIVLAGNIGFEYIKKTNSTI